MLYTPFGRAETTSVVVKDVAELRAQLKQQLVQLEKGGAATQRELLVVTVKTHQSRRRAEDYSGCTESRCFEKGANQWVERSRARHRLFQYTRSPSGITEEQAKRLAEGLKIPIDKMFLRDGIAAFVDPARYLSVPVVPIVNHEVADTKRRATTNHHPEIPIEVFAIDYAALDRLTPLDPEQALSSTLAALDAAGLLTPQHATPVVGNTVFKTVTSEGDNGDNHAQNSFGKEP